MGSRPVSLHTVSGAGEWLHCLRPEKAKGSDHVPCTKEKSASRSLCLLMEEWMEEWSRQIICLPATFLAWLRGDARRHLGASCLSGCEPLVTERGSMLLWEEGCWWPLLTSRLWYTSTTASTQTNPMSEKVFSRGQRKAETVGGWLCQPWRWNSAYLPGDRKFSN